MPASIVRIEVRLPSEGLPVGQTAQATARALDESGTPLMDRAMRWSSTNPSLASIDGNGLVTAVSPGEVVVSATSEGITGSAALVVVPIPVVAVTVELPVAIVLAGQTSLATATLRDASGIVQTGRTITWSSSDTSVATVDGSGLVTAVAPGRVLVSATIDGVTGAAWLVVAAVPVAAVTVELPFESVVAGQVAQATVRLRDAEGNVLTGRAVTWSSSDASVAMVDGNGLVTTLSPGIVTVVANCEGRSGSASLFVGPVPVVAVTVELPVAGVIVGEATQAKATLRGASGILLTGRVVTWSSSNTTVATVDGGGMVTTLTPGSVTVVATCEGRSGSASLVVAPVPVGAVTVVLPVTRVVVGQSTQATATPRDASGNPLTGRAVTWSSSNTAVATVDGSGTVTTVSPGSVTLVATCEERSGSASLVVDPIPVATVTVVLPVTSVIVGQATQATATVRDASGNVLTGRSVTWASSSTAVATVDGSGAVAAIAPGAVSLTASCEGRSGSATLAVNPIPVATVSVVLAFANLYVGQTTQASATLRDANGNVLTGRDVTGRRATRRWRP